MRRMGYTPQENPHNGPSAPPATSIPCALTWSESDYLTSDLIAWPDRVACLSLTSEALWLCVWLLTLTMADIDMVFIRHHTALLMMSAGGAGPIGGPATTDALDPTAPGPLAAHRL